MKSAPLVIAILVSTLISQSASARNVEYWSYDELFSKSDFVVIAQPASKTRDTAERTLLTYNISPGVDVLGVNTEFESLLVLKGAKRKKFTLHHYRLAPYKKGGPRIILNGPALMSFTAGPVPRFYLMFLVRERDGRFAPVAQQTDPSTSVQGLHGW